MGSIGTAALVADILESRQGVARCIGAVRI